MNKKLMILAIALALPLTAIAYPGGDNCPGTDHEHRVERLAKDLNLNDAQKTKVEALFKEQHEKFKVIHDETHTKMQEILTPEQRVKLEEIKKQHEGNWKNKNDAKP
jgi:protein CpxP